MKSNAAIFNAVMTGVLLGLAGCATPPPQRISGTAPLMFSKDMAVEGQARVSDENNPRQIILFAMDLSGRGRHSESARFFGEAAERFLSEDNELAVSCRAAAANECLLAGDAGGFRLAVNALRQTMNRFQTAGADSRLAALLSLGDVAQGARQPTAMTPAGVRDLFEGAEK